MKNCLFVLLGFFIQTTLPAQNKEADAVMKEGKKLYRSEMASWHGTDIFLQQAKEKSASIGGYVSYLDNDVTKCIFVSKGAVPEVLGTITFDSTFNLNNVNFSKEERPLTEKEQAYFEIRQTALKEINKDKLFKHYQNTNFNLVPLIDELGKRVYVLTGSTETGVVIFGNDYLINFNDKNKVTGKKALHASIIPFELGGDKPKGAVAMHTHLPKSGDLMTPTDLCTILLYQDIAGWDQYIVISQKLVNLWSKETNEVNVFEKDAWEKMRDTKKKQE